MVIREEIMLIQILYKQGYSKKRISKELGVSINTVRKYLRGEEDVRYGPRKQAAMLLDPYRDYIQKRLSDSHPRWIPATVIFREIQALGYEGQVSRLRAYMYQLKPQATETTVRFETAPGKQMQVDWAEFRKGKNRLAAFIATLGYSRASYVEYVTNEKLETLVSCHCHAFDYFGGIPNQILYDNMKTVIIERDAYGEGCHRLQSGFWDFAKHYNFEPKVCRPYRPQTKGKVERFIHYLKNSFYYPLESKLKAQGLILDKDTSNMKVLQWLNTIANQRVHGTTHEIPLKRLIEEQNFLQQIPHAYQGKSVFAEKLRDTDPFLIRTDSSLLQQETHQHELDIYDSLLTEGESV